MNTRELAEQFSLQIEMMYDATAHAEEEYKRLSDGDQFFSAEAIDHAWRSWQSKIRLREAIVPGLTRRLHELMIKIEILEVLHPEIKISLDEIQKRLMKKNFTASQEQIEKSLEALFREGRVVRSSKSGIWVYRKF